MLRHTLAAMALSATLAPAQAALTTLDFDGTPVGDATHAFAGLTLRSGNPALGPVGTFSASFADTPGNVLGLAQGQTLLNQHFGQAIDIGFATAVQQVSIRALFSTAIEVYARDALASLPFMAVYRSATPDAASRLAVVTYDAADPCLQATSFCTSGWDTLEYVSGAADIQSIRLSAFAPGGAVLRLAAFDTLTYGTPGGGGGGDGGGTVPLPGTAPLAALALAGLAAVQRRRPHRRA